MATILVDDHGIFCPGDLVSNMAIMVEPNKAKAFIELPLWFCGTWCLLQNDVTCINVALDMGQSYRAKWTHHCDHGYWCARRQICEDLVLFSVDLVLFSLIFILVLVLVLVLEIEFCNEDDAVKDIWSRFWIPRMQLFKNYSTWTDLNSSRLLSLIKEIKHFIHKT